MLHRSPADTNLRLERTALDLLIRRLVSASSFTSGTLSVKIRSRIQRGLYVQTDEKRMANLLDQVIAKLSHGTGNRPLEITGTTIGSLASLSISAVTLNSAQLQSGIHSLLAEARSLGIDLRYGSPGPDIVTVQCVLPVCHPLNRA